MDTDELMQQLYENSLEVASELKLKTWAKFTIKFCVSCNSCNISLMQYGILLKIVDSVFKP